jgi:hypothetical protein
LVAETMKCLRLASRYTCPIIEQVVALHAH